MAGSLVKDMSSIVCVSTEMAPLVKSGGVSQWQAEHLAAYIEVYGFEDLWANPYYRAIREHARAHIERLVAQAAKSQSTTQKERSS